MAATQCVILLTSHTVPAQKTFGPVAKGIIFSLNINIYANLNFFGL